MIYLDFSQSTTYIYSQSTPYIGVAEAWVEGKVSRYIGNISSIQMYQFAENSTIKEVGAYGCTSIGATAFWNCISLEKVNFPECIRLNTWAFYGCTSLQSINLPKCTYIDLQAFGNCTSLKSINLPECSTIDYGGFYGCTSLQSINLPKCSNIGLYAFQNCTSLQSINLPECSNIGLYAFQDCTSLQSIYVLSSTLCSLDIGAFDSTPIADSTYLGYYGSIYVPASLVDSYKIQKKWSNYADRIVAYQE